MVQQPPWGQKSEVESEGQHTFLGELQKGLHAWAKQAGHFPGSSPKLECAWKEGDLEDSGTGLEYHELWKMGPDSHLEGSGWWESWGREREPMWADPASMLHSLWCRVPIMLCCPAGLGEGCAQLGFHRAETQPGRSANQRLKGILGNFSFRLGMIALQFATRAAYSWKEYF